MGQPGVPEHCPLARFAEETVPALEVEVYGDALALAPREGDAAEEAQYRDLPEWCAFFVDLLDTVAGRRQRPATTAQLALEVLDSFAEYESYREDAPLHAQQRKKESLMARLGATLGVEP